MPADFTTIEWFNYSFENPWFFTHFGFLAVFGIFILGYAFLYQKLLFRKIYLILFSLFFYYKSSGPFLLLFLLFIIADYLFAQWIENIKVNWKRKLMLTLSICISLSALIYFKYSGFFLKTMNDLFRFNFHITDIFLPIGISFYTFQSISYIVDVYHGKIHSSKSFLDYAFYMTFFPHLVAGPIVRAKDFIPQINEELTINSNQVKEGIFRIFLGLGKKLLLADYLSRYVDIVHTNTGGYSGAENLFSMLSYSCQIYFDFSGYSDIAIGLAILLGYRLKENFQNPYHAVSITDFWRRWHMSLSSWLRDYIYIPLGGNRKGNIATYIFLMITMTIGGLWHGASWKFVLWGIGHGLALSFHKIFTTNKNLLHDEKNYFWNTISVINTFIFVSLMWIFFRANDYDAAINAYKSILLDQHLKDYLGFYIERKEVLGLLILSLFVIFMPVQFKKIVQLRFEKIPFLFLILTFILILQLILELRDTEIKPFIYFQF